MEKSKKVKTFKILLGIAVIAIIIVAIMYFLPVVKDLSSVEGQLAFQNKFKDSGIGGILAIFGLQIAQIFLVIIPENLERNLFMHFAIKRTSKKLKVVNYFKIQKKLNL